LQNTSLGDLLTSTDDTVFVWDHVDADSYEAEVNWFTDTCRPQCVTAERSASNAQVLTYVTHTHTTILLLFWNLSGTTRVSRYQKGKTRQVKTNLDLLEQETVSGSGICGAICKSAPHPRQPHQHPTTQFFTRRMPFLPPNQQGQSTEGKHIILL